MSEWFNIWHFDRGVSSLVMLVMSVFKTSGESDCAALRLFLVNSAVDVYQSFQLRVRKALIKRSVITTLVFSSMWSATELACASLMG